MIRRTFAIIGMVLFLTGIIIAGLVFFYITLYSQSETAGLEITAVVTNVKATHGLGQGVYDISVSYDYNGQTYENIISGYSESMYKGAEIKILVNPDDPGRLNDPLKRAAAKTVNFVSIFIIILGTVLALTGLLIMLWPVLRKRLRGRLLKTGTCVKAQIVRVYECPYRVKGDYPYIIECAWEDYSGITHLFRSPEMPDDPSHIIDIKQIRTLPVYYNAKNIKKYLVDLRLLEKYNNKLILHKVKASNNTCETKSLDLDDFLN